VRTSKTGIFCRKLQKKDQVARNYPYNLGKGKGMESNRFAIQGFAQTGPLL
jgi:hypothetical protein